MYLFYVCSVKTHLWRWLLSGGKVLRLCTQLKWVGEKKTKNSGVSIGCLLWGETDGLSVVCIGYIFQDAGDIDSSIRKIWYDEMNHVNEDRNLLTSP